MRHQLDYGSPDTPDRLSRAAAVFLNVAFACGIAATACLLINAFVAVASEAHSEQAFVPSFLVILQVLLGFWAVLFGLLGSWANRRELRDPRAVSKKAVFATLSGFIGIFTAFAFAR